MTHDETEDMRAELQYSFHIAKRRNRLSDNTKYSSTIPTVKSIKQTCCACPSQWVGETDDGQTIYARYRWGCFSLDLDGAEVLRKQVGDEFDGTMETEEMQAHTAEFLDWEKNS